MGLFDNFRKKKTNSPEINSKTNVDIEAEIMAERLAVEAEENKINQQIEEMQADISGRLDFMSRAPGAVHERQMQSEQVDKINFLPKELFVLSGKNSIIVQKEYLNNEKKLAPFIELLNQIRALELKQKMGLEGEIKLPEQYSRLEKIYIQAGDNKDYIFIPFFEQLEELGVGYDSKMLPVSIVNMYEKYKTSTPYSKRQQEELGKKLKNSYEYEAMFEDPIAFSNFNQYCEQNQYVAISKMLIEVMTKGKNIQSDSSFRVIQESFSKLDYKYQKFAIMPIMYDLEKQKDKVFLTSLDTYSTGQMFTDLGFSKELQKDYEEFKKKEYSEQSVELKLGIDLLKKMNILDGKLPYYLQLADFKNFDIKDRAMYGERIEEIMNVIDSIQPLSKEQLEKMQSDIPQQSQPVQSAKSKNGYEDCIADKSLRQEPVNAATRAIIADKQYNQDLEMMMRANSIDEL